MTTKTLPTGPASARFAVLVLLAACATSRPSSPIFAFHDNFWMNEHHFLRVVGRGAPAEANMTPDERAVWDAAVALYRGDYSKRDLLFDDGMAAIKSELRRFEGKDSLDGANLDPQLAAALTRAAPVYRKYFWPAHHDANERWIASVKPLLAEYGPAIRDRVAHAFNVNWPADPIPVDLVPSAGANAAYTTTNPTHTTIDALEKTFTGPAAVEILFHEASHAWGTELQRPIARASGARGVKTPPQLWHAVLFYNAGEITRRVVGNGYVQYAEEYGVFPQLCGDGCERRIAATWKLRLTDEATINEALTALVNSWPVTRPRGN